MYHGKDILGYVGYVVIVVVVVVVMVVVAVVWLRGAGWLHCTFAAWDLLSFTMCNIEREILAPELGVIGCKREDGRSCSDLTLLFLRKFLLLWHCSNYSNAASYNLL